MKDGRRVNMWSMPQSFQSWNESSWFDCYDDEKCETIWSHHGLQDFHRETHATSRTPLPRREWQDQTRSILSRTLMYRVYFCGCCRRPCVWPALILRLLGFCFGCVFVAFLSFDVDSRSAFFFHARRIKNVRIIAWTLVAYINNCRSAASWAYHSIIIHHHHHSHPHPSSSSSCVKTHERTVSISIHR